VATEGISTQPRHGPRRALGPGVFLLALVTVAGCAPSVQPLSSPEGMTAVPATPSPRPRPTPTPRPELVVVTIGDSIPYGREDCGNCTTFTTTFAERVASETGLTVGGINLSSHDNLTGSRLVERIKDPGVMRDTVANADVVIVTIGHNDTPWNALDDTCDGDNGDSFDWASYTGPCVSAMANRHGAELDQIIAEVKALRGSAPTAIMVTTDYNDVLGYRQAPPEATKPSIEVLDAFYEATCKAATRNHVTCVDVYHAFNGTRGRTAATDLLAADHTHPSQHGQDRIAELLFEAGLKPLAVP
jgi:lysophospholipase L1-like esterase